MIIKVTQFIEIKKADLKESMKDYDFDTWEDLFDDACHGLVAGSLEENYGLFVSQIGETHLEEMPIIKAPKLTHKTGGEE